MYKVKFLDRAQNKIEWRTYVNKQPNEIEAIARSSGWIVVSMVRQY